MDYQKKIVSYLDGSLSGDEKSEFEAFIGTHPDFEKELRRKEEELSVLRELLPKSTASEETLSTMGREVKSAIYNLVKVPPKSFWESFKNRVEEWTSR